MKQVRYLLVEVIDPHRHSDQAMIEMDELNDLVETLGGRVVGREVQHRVKPRPSTYIGKGKLESLRLTIGLANIDVLVLNALVSSGQKYRIEKSFWNLGRRVIVWDRVDVILQVFEKHATSAEAKLQIELARLDHEGPRVYGLGKHLLSQQAGGIGTRGIGETNIEREKRILRDKRANIRRQLKKLTKRKGRELQRRNQLGLGPVALVGYTSAGKTTLFNRLTGKQKSTDTHLFTTLDTVVGRMKIAETRVPVVVSDTIGFIRALPPQLIQAFRSTLMESLNASLVLHVIDSSDRQMMEKIEVVETILKDLEVQVPVWRVYNKVDRLDVREGFDETPADQLWISAKTGLGIEQLKKRIITALQPRRDRMQT